MKKVLSVLLIVLIIFSIYVPISNGAFEIKNEVTPTSVKVGDTVSYIITTNENIIASNFEIAYENDKFELIGSGTSNLSVAEKNGKAACIYADISGVGTKEFKVSFKAKAEVSNATFSISDYKFRAENQDESYTNLSIPDIKNITVTKLTTPSSDNNSGNDSSENGNNNNNSNNSNNNANQGSTTINTEDKKPQDTTVTTQNKLPAAGTNENIIIFSAVLATLIIVAIIMNAKNKNLRQIFKSGGLMIFALALVLSSIPNNKVYAANSNGDIKIKYYNNLIQNKNDVTIIINDINKREITKQEVMNLDTNITDITDANGTSLNATDKVKTLDKIEAANKIFTVILYGDANSDGIICDADDIAEIIQDYLGWNTLQNEQRLAANIYNADEYLDIDDIIIMIKRYIGNNTSIIANIPSGNLSFTTRNLYFTFWFDEAEGTYLENEEIVFHGEPFGTTISKTTDEKGKIEFILNNQVFIEGSEYDWCGWMNSWKYTGCAEWEVWIKLNSDGTYNIDFGNLSSVMTYNVSGDNIYITYGKPNNATLNNDIIVNYKNKQIYSETNGTEDTGNYKVGFDSASWHWGRHGRFSAELELTTNTNYKIEFSMRKIENAHGHWFHDIDNYGYISEFLWAWGQPIEGYTIWKMRDSQQNLVDIPLWSEYVNEIDISGEFNNDVNIIPNYWNQPFITYRLHDTASGSVSNGKVITMREFYEGIGYGIIESQW